jgi:hypothetical protein
MNSRISRIIIREKEFGRVEGFNSLIVLSDRQHINLDS